MIHSSQTWLTMKEDQSSMPTTETAKLKYTIQSS